MPDILNTIKEKGVVFVVVGLVSRVNLLSEKVDELKQDNQDLRDLIARIRDGSLEDQAYIEIQKLIIDNREVIKTNDQDVWNIQRRIDNLQKQVSALQLRNTK